MLRVTTKTGWMTVILWQAGSLECVLITCWKMTNEGYLQFSYIVFMEFVILAVHILSKDF